MIRLDLKREPYWLDLIDGLRVKVLPCTSALLSAASSSPKLRALPEDASSDLRFLVLTIEAAKLAILDWEGVADEAGEPLPPTSDSIAALMDIYLVARRFAAEYVTRGLLVSAEKNV